VPECGSRHHLPDTGSPMKRILVVEDNPALRSVVAQDLRDEGYGVDTAATIARRLQAQGYLAKPFDLENLVATVDALASATAQGS
jgi:DNA-binding response OmpR family regulator